VTLKESLLLAKQQPGDIAQIIRTLSSLSAAERNVICEGMFCVLEHPRHSLNESARIDAVNVVLAMPAHSVPRLRRILSGRTLSAAEVQFTVFVFMPSAIDALPLAEATLLEKLRDDYLRRPGSGGAASQAAYGMTLYSSGWKVLNKLLDIYSKSPSLVSREAALDALGSAYRYLAKPDKAWLMNELKKRSLRQRNWPLRQHAEWVLEYLERKPRVPRVRLGSVEGNRGKAEQKHQQPQRRHPAARRVERQARVEHRRMTHSDEQ